MTSTAAIATALLTKDYGEGRGLFDLDLEVQPGEVFGWLGPNGAGKTTTIRLLMDAVHPTAGRATVFGLDCQRESVQVKHLVGYLPGELPQFGGMRGSDVVAFLGGMRGGVDHARVRALSERLDVDLGRRFREYSRGNKQKLGLVLAFMHRPRLLILDEPTSGLDPLNQQTFHQLVDESRADGATVFLSSHVLAEVEETCSRVGIVRAGRLVSDMTMDQVHELRFHEIEIDFDGPVPEAALHAAKGVEAVTVEGRRVTCRVRGSFDGLLAAIATGNVVNLLSREPSLESIFLSYYKA